jgi:gas vesicle protein
MLMLASMATSVYSCRETTQEKTEDALESIGEDIETNAKKAGEKIEAGAEKVVKEIDEEVHNTDDQN